MSKNSFAIDIDESFHTEVHVLISTELGRKAVAEILSLDNCSREVVLRMSFWLGDGKKYAKVTKSFAHCSLEYH